MMDVELAEVLEELSERGRYEYSLAVLRVQNRKLTDALTKAAVQLADSDTGDGGDE